MMSAADSDSHVFSEDRCPLLWRHCHKVNAASSSLTNKGVAIRSLDILHPIGFRTEHRYEETLAVHGGDDHGNRASAPGLAAFNFEGCLELRRQPEARPPAH